MKRRIFEMDAKIDQIDYADQWTQMQLMDMDVADSDPFLFACHELVINSVEAMHILQVEKKIRLCMERTDQEVIFIVNDWGGGIPADILEESQLEPIDPWQERGRGLMLIKMMVDRFIIKAEDDGSYSYSIHMILPERDSMEIPL